MSVKLQQVQRYYRLRNHSAETGSIKAKFESTIGLLFLKVSKGAKIRNRYNQVPHLTQDTNGKVTNSQ